MKRFSWLLVVFTLVLISLPNPAIAQYVTDPKVVQFMPSPDHYAVSNGLPLVQNYKFEMYQVGGSQPVVTLDLGKPAPDPSGQISYDFSADASTWPLPGGNYEARVSAVGPGGTTASAVSNAFAFTRICTYSLYTSAGSFAAAGGAGAVQLSTSNGCSWTAKSNVSWVTMGTLSGSGGGSVNFTVAPNASPGNRSGTLTIGGLAYTVTQQGVGCSFSLSASAQSVAAAGGSGSVSVTAASGCSWTATSNAAWLTVTSGSGGTGSAAVTYSAAANTATTARSGTLSIAGLVLTVNQAGATTTTGLPLPWQHQDVGSVGVKGTASYSSGVFKISASGTGIGGSSDGLHFVYRPAAADVQIVTRVAGLPTSPNTSDAGLMLRETLSGGSREVCVMYRAVGQIDVFQRTSTGGATTHVASTSTTAKWLKLVRSSGTVTVSMSSDGLTWRTIASVKTAFTSAYVGLAVTPFQTSTLITATMSNVTVK